MQKENGYTKWWTWKVEPSKEQLLTTIPVVLLCNEYIFSSADSFAKACLDLELATVISNIVPLSGHGFPTTISLPSKNYAVTYGFFEIRGIDFSHLESIIEEPNIKSEQTIKDVHNKTDTQLNKGVEIINNYK